MFCTCMSYFQHCLQETEVSGRVSDVYGSGHYDVIPAIFDYITD